MGRHFTFTGGASAWIALAYSLIMSAAVLADEVPKPSSAAPTRHELWVPTKDLQEVLKKHPNAVVLDPNQYEALVRDAGRLSPGKENEPPVEAVIEDGKVTAQISADATMATLTYKYRIKNLREGWCQTVLPFPLASVAGMSLRDLSVDAPLMVAPAQVNGGAGTSIAIQGLGSHDLRLEFVAPITIRNGGPSLAGYVPLPGATTIPVRLEIPPGMRASDSARLLPDGAWEVVTSAGTRALPPVQGAGTQTVPVFRVDWQAEQRPATELVQHMLRVSTLYRIATDRVVGACALQWSGQRPPAGSKLVALVPKETRVMRARLMSPRDGEVKWTAVDGRVEIDAGAPLNSSGTLLLDLETPIELTRDAVREVTLPTATLDGMHVVQWVTGFVADADVRPRFADFSRLGQPLPENLMSDLNAALHFGRDDAQRDALVGLPVQGPVTSHPRYLTGYVFDAVPENPVIQVEMVPDRFSVDADALVEVTSHEVGVMRTLVFHGEAGSTSRAVVILPESEVFLEVPVTTGEQVLWKQVGRDIEVTWPKGLAKGKQTSLTVRTRRDIPPQAAEGAATEKVIIASIPVSGASRVSGYAALKFDESWKVNVTDTTGLETRDARATPVRGRMAWFGLKEWNLGFDLSRRAPVHDATVTAYALPRAKQVEIEGQIALSVSGAPLRKFEVKLPVGIAPLLRVTSPLVGERSLDSNTGVWTLTLGRELIGTANVRFRMSLPAENAAAGSGEGEGTLTAVLPDIILPGARRSAGRWVVEANTDTELAFTTRGVQPLDARRPPPVAGYSPQHRIIAAYSHGGGEHEIRLTATRHDPASLAGMVLIHLRMTSVLGQDGSARHEGVFTLRHNGRQFATVRLPEGAGLLSAMVDGKVVKPVKAGANEVRLPLASRIGDAAPMEVKLVYDTPSQEWDGSGKMTLVPPTLGDEVPVMETQWKVCTPDGFTLRHDGSGLEERKVVDFTPRAPGLWKKVFGLFDLAEEAKPASAGLPVDFLPGGSVVDARQQEEFTRLVMERLNRIIFPSVQFSGASVEEAVEFLRIKSRDYDPEPDPSKKGVSIIIKPGAAPSTATISLDLKDVPFSEALRYVTELGGMKYKIEPPHGIVIMPVSDVASEMYVRHFKLSLAEMLALKDQAHAGAVSSGAADPFAPAGVSRGGQELPDIDVLKAQGISFPEGSSVRYDRDSQTLVVRNTQPNLDLVETVVNSVKPEGELEETMVAANMPVGGPGIGSGGNYYAEKMSKLIFPRVQFENTPLEEAIEFLRIKSSDYDSTERDPSKKGINFIVKPGAAPSTAKITLDLKDVPMSEALRYVTELAGMKYKVESHAVVVVPITDLGTEMYTRTFKAPPTFFDGGQTPEKPRRTAKDELTAMGIPFPEGSSAVFIPATSQLIVRNTQPSLDLVESYVDQLMVVVAAERRNASLARAKSGQMPLELELPATGQVLTLAGQQRPKALTLRYLSWERQMARTSLLVLLGMAFFWALGRPRVWVTTFIAALLLTCVPVLLLPSWSAACHALLFGWLIALAAWLAWKIGCWWKRRTEIAGTASGKEVVA